METQAIQQPTEAFETGKLYRFNGTQMVEIEPSEERKLPVTEEAVEAVKIVRKATQQLIGIRPELSLVASAMLLAAVDLPEITQVVKTYGQQMYR